MFKEKQKNGVLASILIIIGVLILVSLLFYTPSKSPIFTSHPEISPSNYIGRLGILIATYLYLALGIGAFLLPLAIFRMSVVKFKRGKTEIFSWKGAGLALFFIAFCSSLYLIGLDIESFLYGGGILGFFFLNKIFLPLFGTAGSSVILVGVFLLSILLTIDLSPFLAKRRLRKNLLRKKRASSLEKIEKRKTEDKDGEETPSFVLPPLHLLNSIPKQGKANNEVEIAGRKLKQTLKDFGVEVEIAEIKEGPAITRFEIKLAPGIKVNKVMRLSNDLALSLAVSNIRIEVPVSGKSLIGVEVPKKRVNFVYLRELLEEEVFRESKSKLFLPLGKDIAGDTVWINLESLPHLLIGGSTGSGKSVCINSLIISILYKSFPEEVKFLLIDPKTVELADYVDIPHLLFPPIKEIKETNSALE
ncbi:MAG: DNA translocase FtsK 4TM domain-containing protein, partial [Candidatus Aerophobetes bacterium]|nr:DNA translocase FtsK 4TM domain-containing protein [Candidatus Aerophobetes bacterium]